MHRVLLAMVVSLVLSACTTVGLTPRQGMYQLYGTYMAAQASIADYVEGPTADPVLVSKIHKVVNDPAVIAAVTYGRAYTLCHGDNTAGDIGINCSQFNFSTNTLSGYATVLRNALITLKPIPVQ